MKKVGIWAVVMALVLAVLSPLGALAQEQAVEVIDAMGRVVVIEDVPQRLVSLSPSNTEILFALGVGDKVVGVDSYSDYPAEALAIENKVGDFSGPNLEAIIALDPDVVFADDLIQQEVIDQLDALGIKVVSVTGVSYSDVPAAVQLVAECVGADAAPVLEGMKALETEALAKVVEGECPSVYFALSFGEYGDWTSGSGTFVDDIINMLGAQNIGAQLGVGWMSISLEKLLEVDPDIILIPGDESMVKAFSEGETYKELSAVKNGRVFAVDANMSQRPAPRIAQAIMEFADIFYPANAQAA